MGTVLKYCDDILTLLKVRIPSGIHVRGAVIRFKQDLRRSDLEFRPKAVQKVIDFICHLKHFTGEFDGKSFILQPWQVFIIANLYGFYWKDTGKRRFQTAYIELGRKNGKTAFSAALSLYHLVADGEAAAEVLIAANSKDQAKVCFNTVRGFAKSFDPSEKYLKKFRADVIYPSTNSFIKCLASDSNKLDGYNCSLGIVDEYHSAPNSLVRDVLRSSQGMRSQPLLITITTAGFDKSLPCYELRTVATEIISGIKQDDSFFAIIYCMDLEDDWKDEKNWIKSNPNLDVTISKDFLRKQVLQAVNNPADEVGVKTKNLNIWCDTATVWIPDEYILKATKKIKKSDFKDMDCYVGVDLSSNRDLTAVAYMFFRDEKYYFFIDYYLPHDSLKERPDKELYFDWHNHKYLKSTAGNVVDYDYILKDLLEVYQNTNIIKIYYDKWNALGWVVKSTDEGLPLEPFSQAIGNFNACTKEFERLILSGQVVLDDNPITRYCLRCVELRYDFTGNCKPSKANEKKKIDGVIAMLQALASYMENSSNVGTGIY
jgi:phage terminase large subunit-like protein